MKTSKIIPLRPIQLVVSNPPRDDANRSLPQSLQAKQQVLEMTWRNIKRLHLIAERLEREIREMTHESDAAVSPLPK